jgi:hypothetical protein
MAGERIQMDPYSDSTESSGTPPEGDEAEGKEKPEEETEQTALINKSLFKNGVEPGKIYKIRVNEVYEDEVICELADETTTGKEKDSKPKSAMEGSDANLEKMGVASEGE